MKLKQALELSASMGKGFRVAFEAPVGNTAARQMDYFPDPADEVAFNTQEAAQIAAEAFADGVPATFSNIIVVDGKTLQPLQSQGMRDYIRPTEYMARVNSPQKVLSLNTGNQEPKTVVKKA